MTTARFGRHRTRSTHRQPPAAVVTEQDAALARGMLDIIVNVGDTLAWNADWAEKEIAGGAPPRWVIQRLIAAERMIADATRPERHAGQNAETL